MRLFVYISKIVSVEKFVKMEGVLFVVKKREQSLTNNFLDFARCESLLTSCPRIFCVYFVNLETQITKIENQS